MTLYRPHRGHLADAMKEVVEVKDFGALVAHMRAEVEAYYPMDQLPTLENTRVIPYGRFDKRIGWDATYMVVVNGAAWGFTNGPLE